MWKWLSLFSCKFIKTKKVLEFNAYELKKLMPDSNFGEEGRPKTFGPQMPSASMKTTEKKPLAHKLK